MTHPKIAASIITSLIIFGSGLAHSNEPFPIEIQNPGFESGSGEDVPGWKTYTAPGDAQSLGKATTATFKRDDSVAHTGEASIYIRNEGPRWAWWNTSVELQPKMKYRLSFWMKSFISSSKCSVKFYGSLQERGKRWQEVFDAVNTGAAEWEQFSFEFTTPADIAPRTSIQLRNFGGNGDEVWFDDLELVELME